MQKQLRCIVSGRVQGVSFRAWTEREARRLGLVGWVRNLPDGSVEVAAEGEARAIEKLLAWLGRGPPQARVDRVSPTFAAATGAWRDFTIRYE